MHIWKVYKTDTFWHGFAKLRTHPELLSVMRFDITYKCIVGFVHTWHNEVHVWFLARRLGQKKELYWFWYTSISNIDTPGPSFFRLTKFSLTWSIIEPQKSITYQKLYFWWALSLCVSNVFLFTCLGWIRNRNDTIVSMFLF